MLAENFDMQTYPVQEDGVGLDGKSIGMPATRFWRIGYLDKQGLDKWFTWSLSSPSHRIPEKDIPIIEKTMKASKIVTVRFGCMWIQEEEGGDWKETQLSKSAPEPRHYFEGTYTDLYFQLWRPEAYKYTKDLFEYKRPTSKDESLRAGLSLKDSTIKSQEAEIANLRQLLAQKQNQAKANMGGGEDPMAAAMAMVELAKAGAKAQGKA